jgi:uncharacterized protein YdbL (DUF1318 family)
MKLITPIIVFLLLLTSPLMAMSLSQAKSQGLVGETAAGYIEARSGGGEVSALVETVNAQRRKDYEAMAKRDGIPLNAVERVAGEKLINRVGAGEYYKANGGWQRR